MRLVRKWCIIIDLESYTKYVETLLQLLVFSERHSPRGCPRIVQVLCYYECKGSRNSILGHCYFSCIFALLKMYSWQFTGLRTIQKRLFSWKKYRILDKPVCKEYLKLCKYTLFLEYDSIVNPSNCHIVYWYWQMDIDHTFLSVK